MLNRVKNRILKNLQLLAVLDLFNLCSRKNILLLEWCNRLLRRSRLASNGGLGRWLCLYGIRYVALTGSFELFRCQQNICDIPCLCRSPPIFTRHRKNIDSLLAEASSIKHTIVVLVLHVNEQIKASVRTDVLSFTSIARAEVVLSCFLLKLLVASPSARLQILSSTRGGFFLLFRNIGRNRDAFDNSFKFHVEELFFFLLMQAVGFS
mmetsp:Transcript_7901/g.20567  ORF Transcript_7901/g.20567 Transcript_7901/m.20567 type:complete len:208 (+) Transcript_7901:1119-1742(+)